jgi:hypothetical protein
VVVNSTLVHAKVYHLTNEIYNCCQSGCWLITVNRLLFYYK